MFNPVSVAVANALIPLPNSGTQYTPLKTKTSTTLNIWRRSITSFLKKISQHSLFL
jgi:hypothetical protein